MADTPEYTLWQTAVHAPTSGKTPYVAWPAGNAAKAAYQQRSSSDPVREPGSVVPAWAMKARIAGREEMQGSNAAYNPCCRDCTIRTSIHADWVAMLVPKSGLHEYGEESREVRGPRCCWTSLSSQPLVTN